MLAALDVSGPHLPEPPERAGGSEADLSLAAFGGPGQRGAEIVAFAVELPCPTHLFGAEERGLRLLGKPEVEAGMVASYGLAVAALGEPLERVLPDRLEHSEAGIAFGHALGAKQAVVQERLDPVDQVQVEVGGHGRGAVEREAADEHAEAGEERLLVGREEVVAPVDRGAECSVPLGQTGTRHRLQQLESAAEPLEDRARREQLDPCRSELERERQPVEAKAELGDRLGVLIGELEVGPRLACTVDEQPYRLRLPETGELKGTRHVR